MTLNSILNKVLKPIAEDHLQLNDFGYGDLSNYAEGEEIKYPIMWVVFNTAPYSNNGFIYSFSIVFADKAKDDGSNIISVQSDMISIAADVAAELKYIDNNEIEVGESFTLKPFSERFKDFVSGVVMDVNIKVVQPLNDCETPKKTNI
jgi:sulfate adenylyltransferase subunit 1 (EFTu-like GTPase family)